MNKRSVSIKDIAALSGTNVSTVSRALNDSRLISEKRRREIQALAREMGYRKNWAASNLARSVRNNVIIYFGGDAFRENYFYSPIISSLSKAVEKKGKSPILLNSRNYELALPREVRDANCCGIIVLGRISDNAVDQIKALLHGQNIPLVYVDDWRIPATPQSVVSDCSSAIVELVELTVAQGHKIGLLVTLDQPSRSIYERNRAYMAACAEAGLGLHQMVLKTAAGGYDDARTFFDTGNEGGERVRRTGASVIFAVNDYVAHGILNSARRHAIDVPGALSLAGIDDISINNYSWPRLTTIAIDPVAFATSGIDQLQRLLDGEAVEQQFVTGTLVPGETLGPRPTSAGPRQPSAGRPPTTVRDS